MGLPVRKNVDKIIIMIETSDKTFIATMQFHQEDSRWQSSHTTHFPLSSSLSTLAPPVLPCHWCFLKHQVSMFLVTVYLNYWRRFEPLIQVFTTGGPNTPPNRGSASCSPAFLINHWWRFSLGIDRYGQYWLLCSRRRWPIRWYDDTYFLEKLK